MCSRRSAGLSQPISDCTYLEGIGRATINTHVFISDAEHEVTTLEVDLGEARPVEQEEKEKCEQVGIGRGRALVAGYEPDTEFNT